MKALLVNEYTSVRSLRIQEVPSQEIAPEHVRVRVTAAGIGFVESLKIADRYQTNLSCPGTICRGVDLIPAATSRGCRRGIASYPSREI